MSKKRGFTLVELLAVIVILAIILIIAVPKVISIINDAKRGTFETTAKMIASTAERKKIENNILGNTDDISCESVAKINDIDYESCSISFDGNTAKVTLLGAGKFANMNIVDGTKTSVQVISDVTQSPTYSNQLRKLATTNNTLGVTSINSCATSGKCTPGTAFAIKVNSNDVYKFYVIKDDGKTVTLIMDRNIGNLVKWNSTWDTMGSNPGPIAALEELRSQTNNWTNIDAYNYIFESDVDNYGGTSTSLPLKLNNIRARMLTFTEAIDLGCVVENTSETCPSYLFDKLSSTLTGYWLSTIYSGGAGGAWCMKYNKFIGATGMMDTKGVRPVITLNKKDVAVQSIDIEETNIAVNKNGTYKIVPYVTPVEAGLKNLKYTSSNKNVATVDANGVITGVGAGDAVITIEGSGIKKTINVKVSSLSSLATTNASLEVTSVNACATSGTCEPGTAFAIKVNNSDVYKFYVISDNGSEVAMIMDRNLYSSSDEYKGGVKWISEDDYSKANTNQTSCSYSACADEGPITALNILKARTAGWTNVADKVYEVTDDRGTQPYRISEKMKARLLTYTEASTLNCTETSNSCPSFLRENLGGYDSDIPDGYWLSSGYPGTNLYSSAIHGGITYFWTYALGGFYAQGSSFFRYYGVRPVITLAK